MVASLLCFVSIRLTFSYILFYYLFVLFYSSSLFYFCFDSSFFVFRLLILSNSYTRLQITCRPFLLLLLELSAQSHVTCYFLKYCSLLVGAAILTPLALTTHLFSCFLSVSQFNFSIFIHIRLICQPSRLEYVIVFFSLLKYLFFFLSLFFFTCLHVPICQISAFQLNFYLANSIFRTSISRLKVHD